MLALTVTGLQFLMLPKTKINSLKKPSIIIGEDGFTYCNLKTYSFIKIDDVELSKGNSFKNWINKNSIDNSTQLIVANNPGLFFPKAIFDQKLINEYYEKFDEIDESDTLKTDVSANYINSIIYKVSSSIQSLKEVYLINSSLIHYQTLIYDYLVLKNKNNSEKKLYVNIQNDAFDVFLFFGEQLQLVNRFPIKGPESFLYFLYFIIEKNELKENEFFICFLGNYLFYEEYYKGAMLFHDKIEFVLANSENHTSSTPFLIDLHANYFRNS